MHMLMVLQGTSAAECFITHITAMWTIYSMYMLMALQGTCLAECFIAHITAI
jgi:hypothetical protein